MQRYHHLIAALLLGAAAGRAPAQLVATDDTDKPPVILGKRVEALRNTMKVRPVVVLVKDAGAYCDAVAQWSPQEAFPVLIDDGSDLARENIARFVHAFEPKSVVRWEPKEPSPWPGPGEPQKRQERIMAAYLSAAKMKDLESLRADWKDSKFAPPGVVVASPADPAWTAALALACGRHQEIIWISDPPGQPGTVLPTDQFERLNSALLDGVKATGWTWDQEGDNIEAVTLCTNTPSKIKGIAGGGIEQTMALTDRIGRHADQKRWAWCGEIYGDEATAAYRAMSALFMHVKRAWAFDGYPEGQSGFVKYTLKPAIGLLARTPVEFAFDPARQSAQAWRNAVHAGIDTDVIHVNTRGTMWQFDLNPGSVWSTDVPFLRSPTIVHFIHSYSANVVDHRLGVAGRWLENGAYALLASVDEPYLTAFINGVDFFRRFVLLRGPLSCSVRLDDMPAWKLNLYGDPLIVAGKQLGRLPEDVPAEGPLANAVSIEASFKEHLKAGRIPQGVTELVMLGRDKDAVRVALAALRTGPGAKPRPDADAIARVTLAAAYRERDVPSLVALYNALSESDRKDHFFCSLLWQAGRVELDKSPPKELVDALSMNVRELSGLDDLNTLTPSVRRLYGKDGVRSLWERVIAFTTDADAKAQLRENLKDALRR